MRYRPNRLPEQKLPSTSIKNKPQTRPAFNELHRMPSYLAEYRIYSPNSDRLLRGSEMTRCAIRDHSALQQKGRICTSRFRALDSAHIVILR
jgi:hypothetical protein